MNKTDHFCYSYQLGSLNNNFSSPSKILGAQQLILHMKVSKFQLPAGLLSENFLVSLTNLSGLMLLVPCLSFIPVL
jgi:hypothetical protein